MLPTHATRACSCILFLEAIILIHPCSLLIPSTARAQQQTMMQAERTKHMQMQLMDRAHDMQV